MRHNMICHSLTLKQWNSTATASSAASELRTWLMAARQRAGRQNLTFSITSIFCSTLDKLYS